MCSWSMLQKDNKCRKIANVDSDFRFSLVVRPWTTVLEPVSYCSLVQNHDQRCLYISPMMVVFHQGWPKTTVYTSCPLAIRGHLLGWGPTYSNNHLVKTLTTWTGIKAHKVASIKAQNPCGKSLSWPSFRTGLGEAYPAGQHCCPSSVAEERPHSNLVLT